MNTWKDVTTNVKVDMLISSSVLLPPVEINKKLNLIVSKYY